MHRAAGEAALGREGMRAALRHHCVLGMNGQGLELAQHVMTEPSPRPITPSATALIVPMQIWTSGSACAGSGLIQVIDP